MNRPLSGLFALSGLALAVPVVVVVLAACGGEDEHEHDPSDFANKAECEDHYAEEGHSDDEIADLCADVPE